MALVRIVDPQAHFTAAPPDGVTTDFAVPPFAVGTVLVYHNGQRKFPDLDDGFLEVVPAVVRMKEPPLEGDTLEFVYVPA